MTNYFEDQEDMDSFSEEEDELEIAICDECNGSFVMPFKEPTNCPLCGIEFIPH